MKMKKSRKQTQFISSLAGLCAAVSLPAQAINIPTRADTMLTTLDATVHGLDVTATANTTGTKKICNYSARIVKKSLTGFFAIISKIQRLWQKVFKPAV